MEALTNLFGNLRKDIKDLVSELRGLNKNTAELHRLNENLETLNRQFEEFSRTAKRLTEEKVTR